MLLGIFIIVKVKTAEQFKELVTETKGMFVLNKFCANLEERLTHVICKGILPT